MSIPVEYWLESSYASTAISWTILLARYSFHYVESLDPVDKEQTDCFEWVHPRHHLNPTGGKGNLQDSVGNKPKGNHQPRSWKISIHRPKPIIEYSPRRTFILQNVFCSLLCLEDGIKDGHVLLEESSCRRPNKVHSRRGDPPEVSWGNNREGVDWSDEGEKG